MEMQIHNACRISNLAGTPDMNAHQELQGLQAQGTYTGKLTDLAIISAHPPPRHFEVCRSLQLSWL